MNRHVTKKDIKWQIHEKILNHMRNQRNENKNHNENTLGPPEKQNIKYWQGYGAMVSFMLLTEVSTNKKITLEKFALFYSNWAYTYTVTNNDTPRYIPNINVYNAHQQTHKRMLTAAIITISPNWKNTNICQQYINT